MVIRSAVIASISAAVVLGMGHSASGSGKASIVGNGGLEHPSVGRDATYNVGQTFGGWTVTAGSVDLVGSYWEPAAGLQSADLDGVARGGISQVIPTVAGHRYVLYFALAGNPDLGCDGTDTPEKHVRVRFDGTDVGDYTFNTSGRTHEHMGWVQKGLLLRASSDSTVLEFDSTSGKCAGPVIDDIRLIPS